MSCTCFFGAQRRLSPRGRMWLSSLVEPKSPRISLTLVAVENNRALCATDRITKSSDKTLRKKRKASSNRVRERTRAVRAVRLPFLYLLRGLHHLPERRLLLDGRVF